MRSTSLVDLVRCLLDLVRHNRGSWCLTTSSSQERDNDYDDEEEIDGSASDVRVLISFLSERVATSTLSGSPPGLTAIDVADGAQDMGTD